MRRSRVDGREGLDELLDVPDGRDRCFARTKLAVGDERRQVERTRHDELARGDDAPVAAAVDVQAADDAREHLPPLLLGRGAAVDPDVGRHVHLVHADHDDGVVVHLEDRHPHVRRLVDVAVDGLPRDVGQAGGEGLAEPRGDPSQAAIGVRRGQSAGAGPVERLVDSADVGIVAACDEHGEDHGASVGLLFGRPRAVSCGKLAKMSSSWLFPLPSCQTMGIPLIYRPL